MAEEIWAKYKKKKNLVLVLATCFIDMIGRQVGFNLFKGHEGP
jgi:hypothetical protein